jgi:predicted nucleic acid-binding protein
VIVVDSNVVAARNMEHEMSSLAARVERLDPIWVVPPLWRYEFQNILAKAMWGGRMTVEMAAATWWRVMDAMSGNEQEPSAQRVIELSARHRITGYDANFMALALELNVRCVTEDGELQKKFPAVAVSMENFVKQSRAGGEVRESRPSYRVRKRT